MISECTGGPNGYGSIPSLRSNYKYQIITVPLKSGIVL